MQRNFHIFVQLACGSTALTGRLLYEKHADGLIQSYFRYEASWLTHPDTFPLDPVNLPLQDSVFQLKSRSGLWGVMEDGLPDAWGRRLLQARYMVNVSRDNNIDLLLLSRWAEPGATGFSDTATIEKRHVLSMDLKMTDQAITASEAFEANGGVVNLPDFFISGGSSAGGARPKVLANSKQAQYLVKFPSINDPSPEIMAELEFFGMSCAQQAGIPVPEFFRIQSSASRMALAVRRFDTVETHGRLHFLSFQSLIGIEEQLGLPYSRLADILKKVSGNPEIDLQNLYKQMVINVLICNCDDHLKNFSMLYEPTLQRFCLSPAYDIVPNLWQREHILSVGGKTSDIDMTALLQEGKNFSLSRQRSWQLFQETLKGVTKAFGNNESTLQALSKTQPLCETLLHNIRGNIAHFSKQLGVNNL